MPENDIIGHEPIEEPVSTGEISTETSGESTGIPTDETTEGGLPANGENNIPINNLKKKKMSIKSETGHAKNVANYSKAIMVATAMEDSYNPTKPSIVLTSLLATQALAQDSLQNVNQFLILDTKAIGDRQLVFNPIDKLVTRILNALESSDVTPEVVADAASIIRKLKGRRSSAKLTEEEKQAIETETGKAPVEKSSSQKSFDNRINFFDRLIKFLENTPGYAPNETELMVSTLKALYADMDKKNTDAVKSAYDLSDARAKRNKLLYEPNTGIYDIAASMKSYIRSAKSADSLEFKSINSLKFTTKKL